MRKILRSLVILAACLTTAAPGVRAAEAMKFIHPPPENEGDQRHTYYWELLDAALQANKSKYGDYQLAPYDKPMNFLRAVAELESGDTGRVNVVARATNLDLEQRLRPVPIPLDKGLLGYRLFLIMPEMQARLDKVQSLDDLRQFSIGQASPWTDVKILQAANMKLVIADNYEGLFHMLGIRRYDLFSRGVNEIYSEWEAHKSSVRGLTIEKNLILQYPMPRYFFVPRTEAGARMAERIEDGLQRLAKSGEFERRYQAYKKLVLADVHLAGRRVFRLPNAQLSPLAPLHEKFWWDDLAAELAPKR
ncbi:hypothetical protein VVD49_21530 [Uliginosibacterium sp. H3]|uniref:Solute-binding protein family 3/N-terminal domain-containing protein n=1 Tax=Uliginosibacterium silvisoli TaxID=3114758 RepID=A0ABU6K8U9_9RHOO|nr:hypothetical protein [Uliginosibacterium sp. H3]